MRNCSPLFACFFLLAGSATAQTTWFVDAAGTPPGSGTPGDPFTSIQFAIDSALVLEGDTVLVATGTYAETIDLRGKAITLSGAGSTPLPILDAGGNGSAVTMDSAEGAGTVFRGFRITGGTGTPVGGQTSGEAFGL